MPLFIESFIFQLGNSSITSKYDQSIYDVIMKYHMNIDRPSKMVEQNNEKRSIASFCGMSKNCSVAW